MIANKWNYMKQDNDRVEISDEASFYEIDMDKIVCCAGCGKKIVFGDSFTSREIQSDMGFGYAVCPQCYTQEIKRMVDDEDGVRATIVSIAEQIKDIDIEMKKKEKGKTK